MSFNSTNRNGSPLGGVAAATVSSPLAAGNRRSITVPSRLQPPPDTTEEEPEETLFEHPKATVYKLSKPPAPPSNTSSASPQSPAPTPWKAAGDISIGFDRPLLLRSPAQTAPYLKFRDITIPMMPNTSMWCVDEQSTFVTLNYRIVLPFENNEDKKLAGDFKEALRKIILYEATPCPFKRLVQAPVPQPDEVGSPQRRPTRKLIGRKKETRRRELDGAPIRRHSEDPRSIYYRKPGVAADVDDEEDDEDLESEGPNESTLAQDTSTPMASLDGELDGQVTQPQKVLEETSRDVQSTSPDEESDEDSEDDDSEEESEEESEESSEEDGEQDEDEDEEDEIEAEDQESSVSIDESSNSRNNESVSSSSEPVAVLEAANIEKQDADAPTLDVQPDEEKVSAKSEQDDVEQSRPPELQPTSLMVEDDLASTEDESEPVEDAAAPVEDEVELPANEVSKQLDDIDVASAAVEPAESSAEPLLLEAEPSTITPPEVVTSHPIENATDSESAFPQPEVSESSQAPNTRDIPEQSTLHNRQPSPSVPPSSPSSEHRSTRSQSQSTLQRTNQATNTGLITKFLEILTSPPSKVFAILLEFLTSTCTRLLSRTELSSGVAASLRLRNIPGRWIDSEENSETDTVDSNGMTRDEDAMDSDADVDDYDVPLANDSPGRNGRAKWGSAGQRPDEALASGNDVR